MARCFAQVYAVEVDMAEIGFAEVGNEQTLTSQVSGST